MCQNTKKEFYKKFLYEPLPVEVSEIKLAQNSDSTSYGYIR